MNCFFINRSVCLFLSWLEKWDESFETRVVWLGNKVDTRGLDSRPVSSSFICENFWASLQFPRWLEKKRKDNSGVRGVILETYNNWLIIWVRILHEWWIGMMIMGYTSLPKYLHNLFSLRRLSDIPENSYLNWYQMRNNSNRLSKINMCVQVTLQWALGLKGNECTKGGNEII